MKIQLQVDIQKTLRGPAVSAELPQVNAVTASGT